MQELILAIRTAKEAVSFFKTLLKDAVPNSPQKEMAENKFKDAERALQVAEAGAARNLGYKICRCTWPPQIMLDTSSDEDYPIYKCPSCFKIIKI